MYFLLCGLKIIAFMCLICEINIEFVPSKTIYIMLFFSFLCPIKNVLVIIPGAVI